MHKTMIYIEDAQHKRLQQLARTKGRSVAHLVRTAVDRLLEQEAADRPGLSFIGVGEGPNPDNVSERPHEEVRKLLARKRK